MGTCINCAAKFQARSHGYDRVPIHRVVSESVEVKDILQELLGLQTAAITPLTKSSAEVGERCLCSTCFNTVKRISKKKTELEKLKADFSASRKPTTYLAEKEATAKRRRSTLTPTKTPRKEKKARHARKEDEPVESDAPVTKFKIRSFKRKSIANIRDSKYKTAFRHLTRKSATAKRDFITLLQYWARQEITAYCKRSKYTSQILTLDTLKDFNWDKYFTETRKCLPTLFAVLEATVTTRGNEDRVKVDENGRLGPLAPGFGIVLAVLLRLKRSGRFRLVQSIISAQLYRHGCSQKLQTWLHKAGLCLSVPGTRLIIDRLSQHFDEEANILKHSLEACEGAIKEGGEPEKDDEPLKMMVDEWSDNEDNNGSVDNGEQMEESESQTTCSESEVTAESESQEGESVLSQSENSAEDWEDDDLMETEDDAHFSERKESRRSLFQRTSGEAVSSGYSLTWDNVQHLAKRRHHSSEHKNTFHLWAMSFMTENRISFDSLIGNKEMCSASELPLKTFFPGESDWQNLKRRMTDIVQRMLVENFPEMKARFEAFVTKHIPHAYSEESGKKSHVINLGVQQEDPASTKGVVRILKNLQKYVPGNLGSFTKSILVNGDQLSVERMIGARLCMASSEEERDRFVTMEPSPQEFHKRCLLLQDTMNKLYSAKSIAEKGTLYNMRTKFGHRGVKKHVMDCVNHCTDFLQFTTQGMLCLLALKLGEMSDMSGVPKGCPDIEDPQEKKQQFFDEFSTKLVESCWPLVYTTTIDAINRVPTDDVGQEDASECLCDGKVVSDTFTIECSAQHKCARKRFYHPSCVGLADSLPEEDWWCSEDCKDFSVFCLCKQNKDEQWIGCESEELCLKAKEGWFHLSCVGLQQLPDGEWFCGPECQDFFEEHKVCRRAGSVDHMQEYSFAVLWDGLWHLAHKDAERENDGKAVISQWRLDMVQFWSENHYKYLSLGHRLLAGVSGWLPPRLAEELTWNRIHNLRGGLGNNIPLDLINEFLNNDFKQNLKRLHGQYSEKQVARTSHLIGTVGSFLDEVCEKELMDKFIRQSKTKCISHKKDVNKFVDCYKDCNLFDRIEGRHHQSFPQFKHSIIIKAPGKLKGRLQKYAKKLDMEKAVLTMP